MATPPDPIPADTVPRAPSGTEGAFAAPAEASAPQGEALRLSMPAAAQGRPELARHVAAQVAQMAGRVAETPTEIRLDPQELGRVTLRLATDETGVTLHVTAERAETSELMRRHVGLLQDSYRALGYDRVEISINGRQAGDAGGGGQGGPGGDSPGDGAPADPARGAHAPAADGPPPPPGTAPPREGLRTRDTLDIRI